MTTFKTCHVNNAISKVFMTYEHKIVCLCSCVVEVIKSVAKKVTHCSGPRI